MGIVGPSMLVDKVHYIIKNKYNEIELIDLIYEDYWNASTLVEANQSNIDVLLFTGKIPFKICEELIKASIPWEYLPRHGSTLLRTLLEASAIKKYDITSISFDTYDKGLLSDVYEEIGYKKEELKLYIAEQKLSSENYLDYLYRFHTNNYYSNKISCCITGVMQIHNKLKAHNVPSILMYPVQDVILDTAEKLQLKYLAQNNRINEIVVITVQIDFPNDYSVVKSDEYESILNRIKISECIYLFASKIKAAVVEVNYKEYMIFTTKKILETETNNHNDIYLFELVEEKTLSTVSLGIGYGETVQDAKFNSYSALNRAIEEVGNTGFVVYENGKVSGPLKKKAEKHQKFMDKRLYNISEKTGISINIIYKIYNAAEKCNNQTFHSKELARLCEINQRSMDRFLQKLEVYEFCEVVGKKMVSDTGRASRIIKLEFF